MKASMFLAILLMAAVTFLTRWLPFAAFRPGQPIPKTIAYLGQVLPLAMMAMLVVYCLKNVSFFAGSHGIPEIAASAVVVGLHVWKRNTLLSIAAGTVLYMFLIQAVF